MRYSEKASVLFGSGFNCAQSVLAATAPALGLSEALSLKTACAFGGGMGRQQLTCGAVTGALMAIGLKYGKGPGDSEEKKRETYDLTREFCQEFIRKNGSLNCRELLMGLDMTDPEDNRKIKELGLTETHCSKYVRDAAEMIESLFQQFPDGQ